ncbi:uncharacterized protein [Antedon mediterranea]|uniref:uncharacterized protein n=1 Tax=Antedon mediterranea TaxID=105859 RepID=UPI003AF791A6
MNYTSMKITSGIGMEMIRKMGWSGNGGLGKYEQGIIEPISFVRQRKFREGLGFPVKSVIKFKNKTNSKLTNKLYNGNQRNQKNLLDVIFSEPINTPLENVAETRSSDIESKPLHFTQFKSYSKTTKNTSGFGAFTIIESVDNNAASVLMNSAKINKVAILLEISTIPIKYRGEIGYLGTLTLSDIVVACVVHEDEKKVKQCVAEKSLKKLKACCYTRKNGYYQYYNTEHLSNVSMETKQFDEGYLNTNRRVKEPLVEESCNRSAVTDDASLLTEDALRETVKQSSPDSDLVFTSQLSSAHLKVIHDTGTTFKLNSKSYGNGDDNKFVVSRKRDAQQFAEFIPKIGGSTIQEHTLVPQEKMIWHSPELIADVDNLARASNSHQQRLTDQLTIIDKHNHQSNMETSAHQHSMDANHLPGKSYPPEMHANNESSQGQSSQYVCLSTSQQTDGTIKERLKLFIAKLRVDVNTLHPNAAELFCNYAIESGLHTEFSFTERKYTVTMTKLKKVKKKKTNVRTHPVWICTLYFEDVLICSSENFDKVEAKQDCVVDAINMLMQPDLHINKVDSADWCKHTSELVVGKLDEESNLFVNECEHSGTEKTYMNYTSMKITSGIGMEMIRKMGWSGNGGLGKYEQGIIEPISFVRQRKFREGLGFPVKSVIKFKNKTNSKLTNKLYNGNQRNQKNLLDVIFSEPINTPLENVAETRSSDIESKPLHFTQFKSYSKTTKNTSGFGAFTIIESVDNNAASVLMNSAKINKVAILLEISTIPIKYKGEIGYLGTLTLSDIVVACVVHEDEKKVKQCVAEKSLKKLKACCYTRKNGYYQYYNTEHLSNVSMETKQFDEGYLNTNRRVKEPLVEESCNRSAVTDDASLLTEDALRETVKQSSPDSDLVFTSQLSSAHLKVIHDTGTTFKLNSKSYRNGDDNKFVVSRKRDAQQFAEFIPKIGGSTIQEHTLVPQEKMIRHSPELIADVDNLARASNSHQQRLTDQLTIIDKHNHQSNMETSAHQHSMDANHLPGKSYPPEMHANNESSQGKSSQYVCLSTSQQTDGTIKERLKLFIAKLRVDVNALHPNAAELFCNYAIESGLHTEFSFTERKYTVTMTTLKKRKTKRKQNVRIHPVWICTLYIEDVFICSAENFNKIEAKQECVFDAIRKITSGTGMDIIKKMRWSGKARKKKRGIRKQMSSSQEWQFRKSLGFSAESVDVCFSEPINTPFALCNPPKTWDFNKIYSKTKKNTSSRFGDFIIIESDIHHKSNIAVLRNSAKINKVRILLEMSTIPVKYKGNIGYLGILKLSELLVASVVHNDEKKVEDVVARKSLQKLKACCYTLRTLKSDEYDTGQSNIVNLQTIQNLGQHI